MNRLFAKIVDVKPNEIRALWLSFVFFFVVLAGYYVIRPIRDNIGANNYENLWWMFTVVLITMIAANALFSAIVSRMSRRRFIPIAYRFFIINLIIFFFLMRMAPPGKQPWVDGCFFVWVSVFNLFATTVFSSFMTDPFPSTWTYFQQADLTKIGFTDRAARTAFFAKLDFSVNTLTLLLQIFLTGRLMKFLGVTVTLLFMPVLSLFGFAAMGIAPVLAMLATFQVARRASTFAFMRPAREVLFTVLRREDKYRAKPFIDTFGYRCGDQLGAWSYSGLQALGLGLSAISYIAVPVVAGWCALGIWLGRKQRLLADAQHQESSPPTYTAVPKAA